MGKKISVVKFKTKGLVDLEYLSDNANRIVDEWSQGKNRDIKWNVSQMAKAVLMAYMNSTEFYDALNKEIERIYDDEAELRETVLYEN